MTPSSPFQLNVYTHSLISTMDTNHSCDDTEASAIAPTNDCNEWLFICFLWISVLQLMFVDLNSSTIYVTTDEGKSFKPHVVSFAPSVLVFNPSDYHLVLAYSAEDRSVSTLHRIHIWYIPHGSIFLYFSNTLPLFTYLLMQFK